MAGQEQKQRQKQVRKSVYVSKKEKKQEGTMPYIELLRIKQT